MASALLLIGLLINPDLIQDNFLPSDSKTVPLLKRGEVFTLTSDALVRPSLSGDFSDFEKDGIWLLQGEGALQFRLPETRAGASIEIAVGALQTETAIQIVSSQGSTMASTVVDGGTIVLTSEIAQTHAHSVRISCEIMGPRVDLGRDIRDLCIKLLWVRVT